MNLNQVTVPAIDVEASVAFYEKLGLQLIVYTEGSYARFECPEGNSTFSVHKVDSVSTEPGCYTYFEVADVDALKATYDTYEAEAKRCLAADLVVPAHDYNLKCSHLFNVLDTRGAIGVTERAQYFRRMRNVARQVAEKYVV